MISYYELLGMIKEGKEPNKIKVHLNSTPKIYLKDDDIYEYCYYILDSKEIEDENYKDYLMDSFIESMMFEKNIEILEEKTKKQTMTIIELFNKIANKEKVPTQITYNGKTYYNVGNENQAYYENAELDEMFLLGEVYNESHLNDEVEYEL